MSRMHLALAIALTPMKPVLFQQPGKGDTITHLGGVDSTSFYSSG